MLLREPADPMRWKVFILGDDLKLESQTRKKKRRYNSNKHATITIFRQIHVWFNVCSHIFPLFPTPYNRNGGNFLILQFSQSIPHAIRMRQCVSISEIEVCMYSYKDIQITYRTQFCNGNSIYTYRHMWYVHFEFFFFIFASFYIIHLEYT